MSRALLHLSRHCDCAVASSSKRTLVSLSAAAAAAMPRAGVSCPARRVPLQLRSYHGWGADVEAVHKAFKPWHRAWDENRAQFWDELYPRWTGAEAQSSRPWRTWQETRAAHAQAHSNNQSAQHHSHLDPEPSESDWGHWDGWRNRHWGWGWGATGPPNLSAAERSARCMAARTARLSASRAQAAESASKAAERQSWKAEDWRWDHHRHWGGGWGAGWRHPWTWGWGRDASHHHSWGWGWDAWRHSRWGWGWGRRNRLGFWDALKMLGDAHASGAHTRSLPFTKQQWHAQWRAHHNDFVARNARLAGERPCPTWTFPRWGMRLFATSPFARAGRDASYSPFAQRLERACPKGFGSCPRGGGGGGFGGKRPYCGGSCPGGGGGGDVTILGLYFARLVKCTTTLDCPPDGPGGRRYYSVHVQIRVQQSAKVPHMRTSTLSISTRPPPIRRPSGIGDSEPCQHTQRRWFHPTCRSEAAPLFLWLAGLLKSSTMLGMIHTVTRVAMTLVPFTIVKLKLMGGFMRRLPLDEPKRAKFAHSIKASRKLMLALFLVPATMFWAALVASLERTPLTGRWRMILMSPQEEDEVAKQLQGTGWYNAVADILLSSSEGKMPKVIPITDWRYQWVDETLRTLEGFLPIFRDEQAYSDALAQRPFPTPPPSRFPLVPRPRMSQLLHCFLSEASINAAVGTPHKESSDAPHSLMGPPYNLLLVDKPDTSNGFSYGFGGNGGAGIVVFSGFLDEILESTPVAPPIPGPAPSSNAWSGFLGLGTATKPQTQNPVPTAEQTAQLAVLLAHEVSHLMLAHHLETLSNSTIFAPGVLGIFGDVLRTLLFPLTMLFGPFVNDAVANMTRVSRTTILDGHEACLNRKLEIEADIVSARILAYAGFDPRMAVEFWEGRLPLEHDSHHPQHPHTPSKGGNFWRGGHHTRDTHPVREERIARLKAELVRWETERQKARPGGGVAAAVAASRTPKA